MTNFTLPSDAHLVGDAGHTTVHNQLADAATVAVELNVLNTSFSGGADPSGVADSTSAIQAALNAATPGQVVYLPPGTYLVTSPLTIPPFVILKGAAPGLPLSPNISGHQAGYASVIKTNGSWSQSTAPVAGIILILGQTSGGYASQSQGQQLLWLTIDAETLPGSPSSIHGIYAYDTTNSVNNVTIDHVFVWGPTGHGLYVNTGGTNLVWRVSHCSIQHCHGNGVNVSNSITDSTFLEVYVAGSGQGGTQDGWNITTNSNSQYIGCRSEGSTGNGFTYTSANNTGAGITFIGCSTQGNVAYGFEVTATSASPVSIVGYRSNADGTNAGAGGGNYAGLYVTSYGSPVLIDGYMCIPGTYNSAHCPQYAFKVASNSGGTVTVGGSSLIWGYTTAYSLDGTGNVIFDSSTIFMTGLGGSSPVTYTPGSKFSAFSASTALPTSSEDLLMQRTSCTGATIGRQYCTQASIGITNSGTLYIRAIVLPAGIPINNITMMVGSTGKTGGTHGWYVLMDNTRHVLAVSADQTDASTTWGSTNTEQTLAVLGSGSATYYTTYTGVYYIGVCVTNSSGTQPNFVGGPNFQTNMAGQAPTLGGTSSTGQSTPPSVGTQMAAFSGVAASNYYAYTS